MTGSACPSCGGRVYWDYTCHTWPRTRDDGSVGFMSCLPCDTAVRYTCEGDECWWTYTDGLNPSNPRAVENDTHRPPWLPETSFDPRECVPADVPNLWDLDDDD